MEFVVVATHNERFFNSFIDSLKKYNVKPTILGWGQKYTGHLMKDDLLENYLQKTINTKRVILFCDAFDCLLLKNPNELFETYLKLNKDMIISSEKFSKKFSFVQDIFFTQVEDKHINTGMIMGKNDIFLKCLQIIKKYRQNGINSNQKIWSNALFNNNYLRNVISIDNQNILFYNYHPFTDKIKKNNKFYVKHTNTYPFLIQGNGLNDLNYICSVYGIKHSKIKIKDRINYLKNCLYYYYLIPSNLKFIIFLILIVIIIILIKKLKNKK